MRLRAGLILFLLLALIGGGCRKPLAPTFDRNEAPETWITAAPLDTITTREEGTNRPIQSAPGVIPFRYHMYWAGSDQDGKVAGYYFAVVETLPVPVPPFNTPPPLPGPRARDYHFTSRTDSVFTFSVSQERRDRQHAFYIYAVDAEGKPDPTPARFIFTALDRFPPLPIIDADKFTATGFVFEQSPLFPNNLALTRSVKTFYVGVTDTFAIGISPRSTVPSGSRLDIAWRSEPTTVGNPAVGFRYKLDEPDFLDAAPSVTSLTYNSGPSDRVGPGVKVFRLRAIDAAGGKNETTRHFQMNLRPYAWFSGPDRTAPNWVVDRNERYLNVPNWTTGIPNLPGVLPLGPDTVNVLPSQRIPRKTFIELWSDPNASPQINRIYARAEGDTVHMNSWVLFFSGGFDADSPYGVIYRKNDPLAPDSTGRPVLQIRPPNGSPVGFRSRIPVNLWPNGPTTSPSQSSLYPAFDPASVFRLPTIASYNGMSQSGVAYAVIRAEDGDGLIDPRIGSRSDLQPERIVRDCDSTCTPPGPNCLGGTSEQNELRPMIMKFYVNEAPTFTPRPSRSFPSTFRPRPNEVYATRVGMSISMPAADSDPYDPGNRPSGPGGPSSSSVFRHTLTFRAPRNGGVPGDSVTYSPSVFSKAINYNFPSTVTLGDSLGGTRVRVMIELCDCAECEVVPGQGRCEFYSHLITVPAPPPPPAPTTAVPSVPGAASLEATRRIER